MDKTGVRRMKPSTYLKQRYNQKEALREALKVIDYYLCVDDIKHLEKGGLNGKETKFSR